jgi:DNA-binding LacI/PurR family transcriptional regulator
MNGMKIKPLAALAIEASIKRLDYHPNINARRLVTQKTHTIGVVVEDISNVYFSNILAGIQAYAALEGYVCTFHSRSSNNSSESEYLSLFREGQIDGLILGTFSKRTRKELHDIAECGYPIMLIGDNRDLNTLDSVDVDNKQGTINEVEYLYELGHRNIGYLRGPEKMSGAEFRYKGFMEGMKRNELNPSYCVSTEWTVEGGQEAATSLLSDHPEITALICSNDYCAYGALIACREAGLLVPEDISLVAFDDGPLAKFSMPSLTTIKQPFRQLGEMAARQLIGKIQQTNSVKASILLQSKLIVRQSSGPVKTSSTTTLGGNDDNE